MRDALEFATGFGCIVVGIALLMLFVFGLVFIIDSTSCSALAQTTGHETQFSLWGGGKDSCLIKVDDQWIPTSNWLVNSGN